MQITINYDNKKNKIIKYIRNGTIIAVIGTMLIINGEQIINVSENLIENILPSDTIEVFFNRTHLLDNYNIPHYDLGWHVIKAYFWNIVK